ncbi:uncharacterized protein OCT59_026042 [Rhizophagus irregularis]|uniref:Pyrrolo-quinoline quinone repeat domain-containing protein n=2 Tax=Rhizophagus irregularis TaxID=588596 RepID=A0A015L942_RHIIW|nr:quinon protein alcohol dehydrogenase-like superfamily [Rhizophagus irregularis DAOM 181602=DAOM 197198]EXX51333.1 hypothetical protein RirG_262810 [Rhizophagus irregularis DAOM 197198w]POG74081.1 quinon protein alcohol dehydrogenase-like superfamily [Rhizophagus irregularis DAOM 181602=DAOM 197198]UZO05698.1 hypothetical protein OCT59_026042 [Rhizophagus irregularis]GBC12224.1 PQQ-binding-like beta-propeller repeat protein [Rhizophagus irregularis DAOM 181602=DAOM 197198]|eukprot:XP_025180947.1 quinon protein alcohol dehydrogenase-like superfamily [Rhizophagus irregularis DAOM 181602=DAOM 197198]
MKLIRTIFFFSILFTHHVINVFSYKDWLSFGGTGINNNRNGDEEEIISPINVGSLKVKFIVETGSSVSATPVTFQNNIYFPDWSGNLYSVNAQTGQINWAYNISLSYIPQPSDPRVLSRTTIAIDPVEKLLVFGTQVSDNGSNPYIVAVDLDGRLVWSTLLDNHPHAIITQSATIYDGGVYVGVSSKEEAASSSIPNYQCCTFRGSFVKLDLKTGNIIWKTFMLPDNNGRSDLYSGNAVWGSAPAIDPVNKLVYIATGNNYETPSYVADCVANATNSVDMMKCHDPNNHFDAILALNIDTGEIVWSRKTAGLDNWTVACVFNQTNPQNCPTPAGPDYDFGQAPLLVNTCYSSGECIQLVIATAKSGITWALNAATGEIIWSTNSGPGAVGGGSLFGCATDGKRYFVSQANANNLQYVLDKPAPGSPSTIYSGAIVALDITTGGILWQTANKLQSGGTAPISYSNGVVYYPSYDTNGTLFALNAETGETLFEFQTIGALNCGPSIVNGVVYVGSGYGQAVNNKVYALAPL